MPDMVEQMYCSQQIAIPAMFPYILKQYAKAAIRTQPYDLLRWSAAYFNAMANGETPPVKYRIEYPAPETESGLTPGYLRVLLKQLGVSGQVPVHILYDKWLGVCLNESCLREMLVIGGFQDMVDWLHFVAVAAAHLTDSLAMTMSLCCELLTEEPEGGSAMIPCDTFLDIYTYLARLDCGPPQPSVETVVESVPILEPIVPSSENDLGTAGSLDEEVLGEQSAPASPKESVEAPGETGGPGPEAELEGEWVPEPVEVNEGEPEDLAVACPEPSVEAARSQSGARSGAKSGDSLGPVKPPSEQAGVEATGDDQAEAEPGPGPGAGAASETAALAESMQLLPNVLDEELPVEVQEGCNEGQEDIIDEALGEIQGEGLDEVKEEVIAEGEGEGEAEGEAEGEDRDESVQTAPVVRHVPGIGAAVPGEQIARVELYMRSWADRQEGMVMPRNIRHFLCPPLDSVSVPREFQVDSSQDVHDQSYLYPQRRPITCQDVDKIYG